MYTAVLAVALSLLTSCNLFSRDESERSARGSNNEESSVVENTDSIDKVKQDSIAKAKEDSIAKHETARVEELHDKLNIQGDSIGTLDSRIVTLEKNYIDKTSVYSFMIFELIVFSFIIFMLYRRLKQVKKRISKIEKKSSTSSDVISQKADNLVSKKELNQKLNDLVSQINTKNTTQDKYVEGVIVRLRKLEEFQGFQDHSLQDSITQEVDTEEARKSNVFYMPRTMTKMQFEDSKKKYTKDDTAFFKFTIKKQGKATFIFDPYDESYIGRAYDDRESSLLTVCELETINSTPKTFRNIEPGEAELRGNVWVVTKKLKLQYV